MTLVALDDLIYGVRVGSVEVEGPVELGRVFAVALREMVEELGPDGQFWFGDSLVKYRGARIEGAK